MRDGVAQNRKGVGPRRAATAAGASRTRRARWGGRSRRESPLLAPRPRAVDDDDEEENMRPACDGDPLTCSCVIDTSTPSTLERDFRRWLNHLCSSPMPEVEQRTAVSRTKRMKKSKKSVVAPKEDAKIDGRRVKKDGGIIRNTLGRHYLPGRPLTDEERRVIIVCHLGGMKVNAISRLLGISHGCVSKNIARFRAEKAPTSPSEEESVSDSHSESHSDSDDLKAEFSS